MAESREASPGVSSSNQVSMVASVSRAKELRQELAKLQQNVEAIDASLLSDNVARVSRALQMQAVAGAPEPMS